MKRVIQCALIGCGFLCVIGLLSPCRASAATLSLVPATKTVSAGQTFTMTVRVSSPDQAINAASGEISFPSDKLSVLSISKNNSIMTLWVQDPSFSNQDGVINFGGISVNPGFQGSNGNVVTITFEAKKTGTAELSFLSGSVLANDGNGTNVLVGTNNASVSLVAPAPAGQSPSSSFIHLTVTSVPSVSDGSWYNFNAITFSWNLPADADGVRYGIAADPDDQLSGGSQGIVSQISYDVSQFQDGVWYFSVSYESAGEWSAPTIVSFGLDRTPPEPFVIVRQDANDVQSVRPVFQWAATDKTSGVAYYRVKVGDGDWFDPATIQEGSSYVLPVQSPTDVRTFVVRAYDYAGNFRDASVDFSIGIACPGGSFTCLLLAYFSQWGWLIVLILVILLVISYIFIYRLLRWRRYGFKAELLDFKNELRIDRERLEEESGETNGKKALDLRPSHIEKMKASVEKEMKHLEGDVEEELKKIDKLKN